MNRYIPMPRHRRVRSGRLRGLGQDPNTIDLSGSFPAGSDVGGGGLIPPDVIPTSPSWSDSFKALLPGIFGTASQIAIQQTRPAGTYYSAGPGGVSYVSSGPLSAGSFPPLGLGTTSPTTILLLVGGVVLVAAFARGSR